MYFDSHAHYDNRAFSGDGDALLASMPERGVSHILNPGCDAETSRIAVDLAERYPHVYAAVGWHPSDWESWDENSLGLLRELAARPKVVAIGEIGLDYYWAKEHKEEQKAILRAQLSLARELDLPVIIHDREAHADCVEITGEFPELKCVFHCFSGSPEMAEYLIKRGCYLGFDGPVTYQNNRTAPMVLEKVPLDRILIETDSPYLTPHPHRGKRNDSSYIHLVAEKIAEIKGITTEAIAEITTANAKRLFGI